MLINPARRQEYDQASRLCATTTFRHSQDELFRDLFAYIDIGVSAIFEELAHDLGRGMGMGGACDGHYFRHTLFGGRAVLRGARARQRP